MREESNYILLFFVCFFCTAAGQRRDAYHCNKTYIAHELIFVAKAAMEEREEKGYGEVCSHYTWRTCGSGAACDSAVPRGCSSFFLAGFRLHLPKVDLCGTEGLSSIASSLGS